MDRAWMQPSTTLPTWYSPPTAICCCLTRDPPGDTWGCRAHAGRQRTGRLCRWAGPGCALQRTSRSLSGHGRQPARGRFRQPRDPPRHHGRYVSTVVGNEKLGFADGSGAAARFFFPSDIVVDGEGTIIVADRDNHRLHKIVGDQVTTLAGSSEAGTADGTGAGARFECPYRVALDERGRLLVAKEGKVDTLRVVEASQAPPLWMGPWRRPQQCYPMRPCYKRWRCCATMASWWGVASWRTWCWWWRGRDSPRAGGAKRVLPRAVPVGHA